MTIMTHGAGDTGASSHTQARRGALWQTCPEELAEARNVRGARRQEAAHREWLSRFNALLCALGKP